MTAIHTETLPGRAPGVAPPAGAERRGMLAAVAASLATLMLGSAPVRAAAVLSNTRDGVTVKAAPMNVGADAAAWEFTVALDTHVHDLVDDLPVIAVLVTDDGRRLKPSTWKGTGPGGRHREGVLVFDVPAPRPKAYSLEIARAAEPAPRVFRWK